MEVNPLQESSIADAEPATVDTTDNGIHFLEVEGRTKRGGRKLFDNQGYSNNVHLRTNGKCWIFIYIYYISVISINSNVKYTLGIMYIYMLK